MAARAAELDLLDRLQAGAGFRNEREALQLFGSQSANNSDLTTGGEIISTLTNGTDACSEVLWLEPECAAASKSDTEKSARMWPFAMKHASQKTVEAVHEPFLKGESAWILKTKYWFSLSSIMAAERRMAQTRSNDQLGSHPEVFLILLDGVSPEPFQKWERFKGGLVALVYRENFIPILETCTEKRFLCSIMLEGDPEKDAKCFKNFYDWLQEVRTNTFSDLGVYAGFRMGAKQAKLWAALTTAVKPTTLAVIESFYDRFQARYADLIRRAASDGLEVFWEETKHLNHDTIENGQADEFLRRFIDQSGTDWPKGLDDAAVREALKTMCGQNCAFASGGQRKATESLTTLGGFFFLLAAIASKFGASNNWLNKIEIDFQEGYDARNDHLLPEQNDKIATAAARYLFKLFTLICEHRKPTSVTNPFLVRKVILNSDFLEIHVALDPQSLSKSVGYELSRLVSIKAQSDDATQPTDTTIQALDIALPDDEYHAGTVAGNIARFVTLAAIRVIAPNVECTHELFFPPSALQLISKPEITNNGDEKRLILRFNKCKTSL